MIQGWVRKGWYFNEKYDHHCSLEHTPKRAAAMRRDGYMTDMEAIAEIITRFQQQSWA